MMNKIFPKVILFAMALGITTTSCQWGKGGRGDQAGDSLAVDTVRLSFCSVTYEDSTRLVGALVEQYLHADYPDEASSSPLADSIRAWLFATISQSCYAPYRETPPTLQAFKGELSDGEAIVNHYGKAGLEIMATDIKDMAADGFDLGFLNRLHAEVLNNEDAYVTYNVGHEIYTGGAHGSYISYGQTFRRSDGCQLGWNLLDLTQRTELTALIKDGLKEYFSLASGDSQDSQNPMSDEALMEWLMLYDNPETPQNELEYGIPLPQTPPCVVPSGLAFVYQQYEIAAYAAGLPSFTIPFDKIKPLLSDLGLQLLDAIQSNGE